MSNIVHRCPSGETTELEQGRYLPDAQEYRTECDTCGPVYNDGVVEHD